MSVAFDPALDPTMSARSASSLRRWLGQLEEAGVIRQWSFAVPVTDDEEIIYDVFDPDADAPVMLAGDSWHDFVEEIATLTERGVL
jgi:hypothetical protein